jgi:hypothetical protein
MDRVGVAADDAEKDLFECEGLIGYAGVAFGVAGLDAGAELLEGAVGDEVAAVDDGDVGAEALDDLEDVRGEEDGGAASDHALEHGLERARGDGVDAFEGLVEEEDPGAVDDGCGEGELFLHAVGEVGDELAGFGGEAHEVEELGGASGGGGGVEAVHATDEAEVFGCGEATEEGEAFGDDTDLSFDLDGVGDGVEAKDLDGPGGGCEEASEHLDGGGFASAVRAEEAEELAGGNGEVDVLDGGEVAETAGEACRGHGGGHVREGYLMGEGWLWGKSDRLRGCRCVDPICEWPPPLLPIGQGKSCVFAWKGFRDMGFGVPLKMAQRTSKDSDLKATKSDYPGWYT